MNVLFHKGRYEIVDIDCVRLHTYDHFPTIEALENHIKLMLIAVQNYNSKISQPVQQDDWTFDEPIDYSARYYHE